MKENRIFNLYNLNVYVFIITCALFLTRIFVSYRLLEIPAIVMNIAEFLLPVFVGLIIRTAIIFIISKNKSFFDSWKHKNLAMHFINAFTFLTIITGLSISFRNNLFFIDGSIVLISGALIYLAWMLLVNKREINTIFKKYVLGIDLKGKHAKLLLVDIKALIFVSLTRALMNILVTTIKLQNISATFAQYSKYLFFFLDFITVLLSTMVLKKLLDIFLLNFGKKVKSSDNEIVKNYLFIIPLASNLIRIFSFLVFAVLFLNLLGYTPNSFVASIPSLIQSISIFAAGLSFAARDNISNFLSGILILTDSPFNIGDRVRIDGVYGDVEEIGIRTTKIKTLENSIVTVPNSKFTNHDVTSYRKYNSFTKIRYKISVSIEEDMEKIRTILYDCLNSSEDILKVPSSRIYLTDYDSFRANFLVVFWVRDISKELISKDVFNSAILSKFKEHNIKVSNIIFPTVFNDNIE